MRAPHPSGPDTDTDTDTDTDAVWCGMRAPHPSGPDTDTDTDTDAVWCGIRAPHPSGPLPALFLGVACHSVACMSCLASCSSVHVHACMWVCMQDHACCRLRLSWMKSPPWRVYALFFFLGGGVPAPGCRRRGMPAQEGIMALWRGWLPSVIGVIPYVGLNFAVYETSKDIILKYYGACAPQQTARSLGAPAAAHSTLWQRAYMG
jgi:Mitochondrial carrier protein